VDIFLHRLFMSSAGMGIWLFLPCLVAWLARRLSRSR
jgi:hypothetical protein